MTDTAGKNFIDLTANIVSAYLANNPTPATEIPATSTVWHSPPAEVEIGEMASVM